LLGRDHGYLHRDISSGNVLIDDNGMGVLIDYDLAVRYPLDPDDLKRSQRSVSRAHGCRFV